jgi:hypothetical protein
MLVLDVTGSMSGDKIVTLRKAATDFVNAVIDGEGVRVGVVPFSNYVNIGTENRTLDGFDIPADTRVCTTQTVNTTKTTCTGFVWKTCYNDGVPYQCKQNTGCTTVVTGTKEQQSCTGSVWTGCVGSREPPLNAQDSDPATAIPGVLNSCNKSKMVRLTDNKTALLNAIKNLNASGSTYIPGGLMMGWHALSPLDPLPDGSAYEADVPPVRAIVLMTDGENTVSKTNKKPTHGGSSQSAADTLTKTLCANIKQEATVESRAAIQMFTIAFQIDDDATRDMLEDCADEGNYYNATDSDDLIAAFEEIVGRLSRLRLVE